MSSAPNPRRTTKTTSSAMTPSSGTLAIKTNMTLRKGATFHQPPSSPPSLPRRSQTNLEDVIEAHHRRRVALALNDIERTLTGDARDPTPLRDEASPVPTGFLNHTAGHKHQVTMANTVAEGSDYRVGGRSLRPRRVAQRSNQHESDSGLGSSILSEKRTTNTALTSVSEEMVKSASAITRSAATHASTLASLPRLSERATNRITEHILKPLLAKPSLKDFHSIVNAIPQQIHKKEIVCLRDLEKTLIFRAPERSRSAKLYLDFTLVSIRCIQATVEFLSEREQTRPSDRPYTNGYFIDLVDQIRSYAQQVQASKEKESKGESLGDMDAEASDEIKLYGGLTRNGRPAEMVRVKKNGKAISLATGQPVPMESVEEDDKTVVFKRSMSQELADEDAIMRSMARRKRSASAAELAPKRCREPNCTKEFKRSCDLTKHEKTHSRPWKCPEEECKYREYGWPTEKELDRHVNDKHSASPVLYKCLYEPCPYKSKRESNCKQHMEKSHGWTYVRSKNNGKNRSKNGDASLPTPQTMNHQTPESENILTPNDDDYDMSVEMHNGSVGSVGFNNSVYNEDFTHIDEYPAEFDFNTMPFISPVDSNNHNTSMSSSTGSSPFLVDNGFQLNANVNVEANFGTNFGTGNDFMLYGEEDIYNAQARIIPTQVSAILQNQFNNYVNQTVNVEPKVEIPHISPGGHGNTMLYTPTSLHNTSDSFEYEPELDTQMGQDFQLFANTNPGMNVNLRMGETSQYETIPSAIAGFSQPNTQEFIHAWYASQSGVNWMGQDEGYSH